jgi:hypothetical protein
MPSANLNKHKARLTLAIQEIHSSNLDPLVVGALLRRLREGLSSASFGFASDPDIDYEEKGRLLTVLAMVTESITDAHEMPRQTVKPLPKLNR